jgi:flagellar basal body-associated protein FliL
MAGPKIKKKGTAAKASPVPRQGALPCLIVVALVLLVAGLLFYFSLRSAG